MNIYCKFNNHYKDILVCKFSCPRELKCPEFQKKYEEEGRQIRWNLFQYMQKHPDKNYKISLVPKKGRKTQMKKYVCMREGQVEILTDEQITEKTKAGEFFKEYFELGKEMELVIKLLPKKNAVPKINKTKK